MCVIQPWENILHVVTNPLLLYLISKFYNKEISSSSNQKSIWKLREVPQEAIESVHCTNNRQLSGYKKKLGSKNNFSDNSCTTWIVKENEPREQEIQFPLSLQLGNGRVTLQAENQLKRRENGEKPLTWMGIFFNLVGSKATSSRRY